MLARFVEGPSLHKRLRADGRGGPAFLRCTAKSVRERDFGVASSGPAGNFLRDCVTRHEPWRPPRVRCNRTTNLPNRMRTLPLVLALAGVASCLSAQSGAEIALEIDTSPPNVGEGDDPAGDWRPAQGLAGEPGDIWSNFRIRMRGTEGGWWRPTVDVVVLNEGWFEGHEWVYGGQSRLASQLAWHGAELVPGDDDFLIYRGDTAQRWVDLAMLGGAPQTQVDAVKAWCQPFLTQSPAPGLNESVRMWGVDAPLWAASPAGQVHRSFWETILRDREAGLQGRSFTTLSTGMALHFALVQQSIVRLGSPAFANALVNTPTWTQAVQDGHVALGIQGVAIRAFNLPVLPGDPNWQFDEEVPDLGGVSPAPKLGSSRSSKWIVNFSQEAGEGVEDLTGRILQPGRRCFIDVPEGTYPVKVKFSAAGGGEVEADAVPFFDYFHPARWAFFVPQTAITGSVAISTGHAPIFDDIGTVTIDQPTNAGN
ncbi:MAG: hypothetical protein NXI31_11070 [bacterium]|nr:hypothetical protein [bacterium]